ncbi:sensor histidine kinase [Erysipelothrix aquatica]|uniref:sensor histidine kinase n=1 Tax=Erysipelothrix aquatica TaxID=2683714 RepID=UPI001357B493|nr:GHKL domain-containing protein [Erysipelothrix aquatica]
MISIFLPLLLFSGYLWIKNLSKVFEKRFDTQYLEYLLIIVYALDFFFVDQLGAVRMSTFYLLIYLLIMTYAVFTISHRNLLTISLFPILFIYTVRGCLAAIIAFLFQTTTHEILTTTSWRWAILVVTYLIFNTFVWIGMNSESIVQKQIKLFRNTMKTKHVLRVEVIMLFYLMIINDGRFLTNNVLWFNTLYLSSSLFILVILCVSWTDALRGAELLENARYTHKIENQLKMQIEHYETYRELMIEYQKFKHDYRSTLRTINTLINSNQIQSAQNLIDQTNNSFKDTVALDPYSQSHLLDAIIRDVKKRCTENEIRYDLDLHLPELFRLSELDMLRVITNLVNNAIEASLRIENPEDRYIAVSNHVNKNWLSLTITNNYSVAPIEKYGVYQSTKENADIHGIGLQIVREIIENAHGILKIEVNEVQKQFIVTILVQYE